MPKEQIRKRGKRKPKTEQEDGQAFASAPAPAPEPEQYGAEEEETGGIHPERLRFLQTGERPVRPPPAEGEEAQGGEGDNGWAMREVEYPFGVLDPDVKAYFRNVEEQIKDWEGVGTEGEEREDRQLFLTSVLSELRGHELQVATDPDCAVILERLLPSLNDWGRRVIGDAVGEGWQKLFLHRFGSHVVQTWLTLAAGTLDREARDIFPAQHHEQAKDAEAEGVLPTMAEIVATLVNCLLPTLPTLLTSAHASPPLRLLFLVLTPHRALPSLDSREGGNDLVRSKRSGKWRKGQNVQGKSILGDGEDHEAPSKRDVPASAAELNTTMRSELMTRVQPVEWQSMGVDKVGSAVVQLLLELESDADETRLLDIITEGLVEDSKKGAQPYLSSLLISATGTRLFEAVLAVAPSKVFKALWKTYFSGKLGKLATHPYANFVVAKGIARLDSKKAKKAVEEIQGVSGGRGLIKTARTGALLALVERATALGEEDLKSAVEGLVKSCLDLQEGSDALVPCLMTLKTWTIYRAIAAGEEVPSDDDERPSDLVDEDAETAAQAAQRRAAWENRRTRRPKGVLEPSLQGCLVLQALVPLPSMATLDSLLAQPVDTLLGYTKSPVASRFLDRVFTSAPAKYKRKLAMAFIGHYDAMACDRLGSRVAETAWASSDGFMREKMARSLIPQATMLAADQFGRFLSRKLELHLLERRPDEWREKQIGVRHHFAHQKDDAARTEAKDSREDDKAERKSKKEKRKDEPEDEIDDLFATVEKKRRRKH